MERILIPTDFSELAQNAVDYGVELARRSNARITVMHTIQRPQGPPQGPIRDRSEIPKEDEQSLALWQELESLSKWIREGHSEIEKVSERMPNGLPGDEILKAAAEEGSDLIVMGTKGEKGFSDTMMGTTAANVIQKTPCNVLMVPEDARFKEYRRVAYATAFHPKDTEILKGVLEFLDRSDCELRAVHVLDEAQNMDPDEEKAFLRKLERAGLDRVKLEEAKGSRLESALDAYIQENQIDLLVMLNESRNFIQRLFQSSKSKKMAFQTRIPLLVMHADES